MKITVEDNNGNEHSFDIPDEAKRSEISSNDLLSAILAEAVAVIYLDDNSDYKSALWTIINLINPRAKRMLQENPRKAYQTFSEQFRG